MAIQKPIARKSPIADDKTRLEQHRDSMYAKQVSFDVVVEQVIGSVEVGNGYGTTPTVAAFDLIARHVEQQPRGTGEDVDLTFRFQAAGGMHSISVRVS